jgi:fumarylacetoacetate (FAA) hydrolase
MRLATIRDGSRDGALVVVRADGTRFAPAPATFPNLQAALDRWAEAQPALAELAARLDRGQLPGTAVEAGTPWGPPLPRAYEWLDGSAFLHHVRLARRSRGAEIPPELETDPLMYQGGSGVLLGPTDPLPFGDPALGLDFEAEVAVILGDVPRGIDAATAASHIRLVCLLNDVTLRNLVPRELAKGFGFVQSKPATAFAPFAVTPDQLGSAFRDGRLWLRVRSSLNGQVIGDCDAGEMHFSFGQLIAHVARTRALTAGTILGSGTVSNEDATRGVSCLVERRMRETLESGTPRTDYLKPGDTIRIEVLDGAASVFGVIEQTVVQTVVSESEGPGAR